ncbi:putative integral membrane protein [Phaeomoniella chlamydospora]|uniref:Putative integral membrane protein n=1 Tax=Phaeomoniella chlamydospora TaxID=158046 RepID=A0A0G2F0Q3_PHACM|nr:putative integral membrane protein [Phaeomoniella chlamydospora]
MDGSQLLDLTRSKSNDIQHGEISSVVGGVAKHTLGLLLLLLVVFLWTLSNFLGSTIFADNTFAKPFFMTYFNTSFFVFLAAPTLFRQTRKHIRAGNLKETIKSAIKEIVPLGSKAGEEDEPFLKPDDEHEVDEHNLVGSRASLDGNSGTLGLLATAKISFEFCILWFLANYLAMACLQHTTVGSATIFTSTSSVWTLLIGAVTKAERFTFRKLLGVCGALFGVILVSHLDYTSDTNDKNSDSTFPDKSPSEIALGDFMALLSAFIYAIYTIVLKLKVGSSPSAPKVNMSLFFGLVGFFNLLLLWPLFPILSLANQEPFELPPTPRIWFIIITNSLSSLLSDIAWAHAMILTSPLVVTVGLSLTIPLSLIGEMIVQSQFKGWAYWVGAAVVVAGFGIVEVEEKKEEVEAETQIGSWGDEEDALLVVVDHHHHHHHHHETEGERDQILSSG